MTKRTKIISAYPCCGKSYITLYKKDIFGEESDNIQILDSDSSKFSWIIKDGKKYRNPNFATDYIKYIKSNIGKVDYIFVSSHKEVREALRKNNIKFTIVIPNKNCLNEWIVRMYNREDDDVFINKQIENWDKWLTEIDNERGTYSRIIKLNTHEYLSDVLIKC